MQIEILFNDLIFMSLFFYYSRENYDMMRNCVRNEVKQCFDGLALDKETTENISETMVMESLPDEDANVSGCLFNCMILTY